MHVVTLVTFFAITGAIGLVSWYNTRRHKQNTVTGFFFANRSLGMWAVGSGLLFANINTVLFVGENELVYTHNMSVMAWGVTSVIAMLIVSEFVMPVYLKTGISTTPDFLEKRYDTSTKRIVSFIFLVNYIVNLLPSVLYGGAVAFNGLFHISDVYHLDAWTAIWVLVWMMGVTGGLYCLLGGMRAIAVSDIMLGAAMFTGGLVLPWLGLKYLGNGDFGAGLQTVLSSKQEHLNSIGTSSDPVPFSTIFTGMLLVNLYYWGTEQYIVQQVLSSKNLAVCQKGIALASFGKLICPLLINIPGLIAVHLYDDMDNTAEAFSRTVSDVSPPFYAGYMAALLFGATFTTFNAGLNSSSTIFILNIYQPWAARRARQITERQYLATAKRFEAAICLLAMIIAPFFIFARAGFYNYLQMVGGLFSVPIFTIVLVGMLTKKVPAVAAKAGLAFFILSYGITQFVVLTRLHFLHVLAILFLITSVLMLIIGKLWPQKEPYRMEVSNAVDIRPWKSRYFFAAILVILMIILFITFSPLGIGR